MSTEFLDLTGKAIYEAGEVGKQISGKVHDLNQRVIRPVVIVKVYAIKFDVDNETSESLFIFKKLYGDENDQTTTEIEVRRSTNVGNSMSLSLIESSNVNTFEQLELGDYIEVFYDDVNVSNRKPTKLQFFGQIWNATHEQSNHDFITKVQARDYVSILNNVQLPKSGGIKRVAKLIDLNLPAEVEELENGRSEGSESFFVNNDLLDYIDGVFTLLTSTDFDEEKFSPLHYLENAGVGVDKLKSITINVYYLAVGTSAFNEQILFILQTQYAKLLAYFPNTNFIQIEKDDLIRVSETINRVSAPFTINVIRYITCTLTIANTEVSTIGEIVSMDQFSMAILTFSGLAFDHGIDKIVKPIIEISKELIDQVNSSNARIDTQKHTLLTYSRFYVLKLETDAGDFAVASIDKYRRIGVYNLDSFRRLNEFMTVLPQVNFSFIERFLSTKKARLLNDNTDSTAFIALILSSIPFGTTSYYHQAFESVPNVADSYENILAWIEVNADEGFEEDEFQYRSVRNGLEIMKLQLTGNAVRNNNFLMDAFGTDSKLISYIKTIPGSFLAGAKQLGARYQVFPTEFLSSLKFVSLIITSTLGFMPSNQQILGSSVTTNRGNVFRMNNVIISQENILYDGQSEEEEELGIIRSVPSVTEYAEKRDSFNLTHVVKLKFALASVNRSNFTVPISGVEDFKITKPSTNSFYGKFDVKNVYTPEFVAELEKPFIITLSYNLEGSFVSPMALNSWSLIDIVKSKTYNPINSKARINFSNISNPNEALTGVPIADPFLAPVIFNSRTAQHPSVRRAMTLMENISPTIKKNEQHKKFGNFSTANVNLDKVLISNNGKIKDYIGRKLVAITSFCDFTDTIRELKTFRDLSKHYKRSTESVIDLININVDYQFKVEVFRNGIQGLVLEEAEFENLTLTEYLDDTLYEVSQLTLKDMAWTVPIKGMSLSTKFAKDLDEIGSFSLQKQIDNLYLKPVDIRIYPLVFRGYRSFYLPVIYLDLLAKATKNFIWNIAKSRYSMICHLPAAGVGDLKNQVFNIGKSIVFTVDRNTMKKIAINREIDERFDSIASSFGLNRRIQIPDGRVISVFKQVRENEDYDEFDEDNEEDEFVVHDSYFTWFVVENTTSISDQGFRQKIGLTEGSFDSTHLLDYAIMGTRLVESLELNQMSKFFLSRRGA